MSSLWSPPVLLLAAVLPAQRTWIVDAAGGAGVHFTDLPPAVAAASDDDIVLVRPATTAYRAATVTKGLHILGTGLPVIVGGAPLTVRGISAGKQCTVAGVWLDPLTSWVSVEACAGQVTLRGLSAGPTSGFAANVLHSQAVVFESCAIESGRGTALTVNSSSLHCIDCVVRGLDAWPPAVSAAVGIFVADSRLVLVHTAVFGGRVLSTPGRQEPALAGIRGLTLVTGRSSLVAGGAVAISSPDSMDLVLEPLATVVGSIAPSVRMVSAQLPALSVQANLAIRCDGLPDDVAALFVSAPHAPQITALGEQWIDLARAVLVDVGVLGAPSAARIVAVPLSSLRGVNLSAQSLVLRGGSLLWSTPLRVVTPP